jgi:hypothetical protein
MMACAAAAVALTPAMVMAQAGKEACDRSCLVQILDQYLDHMQSHNPAGLPVAADANVRELTVPVKLGEGGSWKRITKLRTKMVFADPTQGSVMYRGAVDTTGKLSSLSVRLKVENRRITESETIFNEAEGMFDETYLLEPDPFLEAVLPPARRSSREELIKIANSYFEAVGSHNPAAAPFAARCERYESGRRMTHNKAAAGEGAANETCSETLQGLKGEQTINRRFMVVDAERGIVIGATFIQHAERKPPNSLFMHEMFKIVDGKIWEIDNIAHAVPWPPDSGYGKTVPTASPAP